MALIKSISGIRGTIGGKAGEGLNPLDIVKFTSAYATLIRRTTKVDSNKIVVGRDARISGEMVKNVVCGTLMGVGFDVVNGRSDNADAANDRIDVGGGEMGVQKLLCEGPERCQQTAGHHKEQQHLQPQRAVEPVNHQCRQRTGGEPDGHQMNGAGSFHYQKCDQQTHPDNCNQIHIVASFHERSVSESGCTHIIAKRPAAVN